MKIIDKAKERSQMRKDQQAVAEENAFLVDQLYTEYAAGEVVYSSLFNKLEGLRDFYLGETSEQWDMAPTGDLQLVVNLGAAIIDLFTYILANNSPAIQALPLGTDPVSQVRADFIEEQANRLLEDARFPVRFRDGAKNQFLMGFALVYPFWNPNNKTGSDKGTFELSLLNPFTTRVVFESNDYEKPISCITVKRMLPSAVKKLYKFDAIPDSELKLLPSEYETMDDGMVSVFTRYDEDNGYVVINGRLVGTAKAHPLGRVPLYKIDNIKVPNDPFGRSEVERWQELCQETNALLTAASEIARDLGYPPILNQNNALGSKHIQQWRGNVIPVRRSDKGEAVSFMINPAQIEPILKQAGFLIELLHFVSLMPKAAAGMFESNIQSGFQAKLAMQPATLATDSKKLDWEEVIKQIVVDGFRMLEKHNSKALTVGEGDAETKINDINPHEIQVIWSDNLPIDVAREVQNLIMGLQNNLTSVHQAVDKYNALMGLGSPADTFEFLAQESEDPNVNPERVEKVAKVKQQLQELSGALQQVEGKVENMRGMLNQGSQPLPENLSRMREMANPVNLMRSATSPLEEERRPVPGTAREAIPLESTGGVAVPPGV